MQASMAAGDGGVRSVKVKEPRQRPDKAPLHAPWPCLAASGAAQRMLTDLTRALHRSVKARSPPTAADSS